MEQSILLSVIIPTYNSENRIQTLFNHLFSQISNEVEYIFVDDGSVDNTYNAICDLKDAVDENFVSNIIVIHQENQGTSTARSTGMKECRGKYITFVDDDDSTDKNYIENLISIIKNNADYEMYITGVKIYGIDGKLVADIVHENKIYHTHEDVMRRIITEDIKVGGSLWSHIYDKKFLDKHEITFEKNLRIHDDALFNWKCYLHLNNLYISNYTGYMWIRRAQTYTGIFHYDEFESIEKCREMIKQLSNHVRNEENKYIDYKQIDEWEIKNRKRFYDDVVFKIEHCGLVFEEKKNAIKTVIRKFLDYDVIYTSYKGISLTMILLSKVFDSYYLYYLLQKLDRHFLKRVKNKLKIIRIYCNHKTPKS